MTNIKSNSASRPTAYSYDKYAQRADDTAASRNEKKVLYGYQLAARKLSAEDVATLLADFHVLELRRHLLDELPAIALVVITLFISYLGSIYLPFLVIPIASVPFYDRELNVGIPLLHFLPIIAFIVLIYRFYDRKFIIGTDSSTLIVGILSLQLRRVQIQYDKVKELEVRRSIYQRLVNTGDLKISTAMFDEPEVTLDGLHNPYYYATLIRYLAYQYQERMKSGSPAGVTLSA